MNRFRTESRIPDHEISDHQEIIANKNKDKYKNINYTV